MLTIYASMWYHAMRWLNASDSIREGVRYQRGKLSSQ
jgi:hypothetical protein